MSYSISKAYFHTDRIKRLQLGEPISPTLLQVDLEAYCNDNCSFCSYRKEEGYNEPMLELIQVKKTDDRNTFKPLGIPSKNSGLNRIYSILLPEMMKEARIPAIELTGGGEPTIWPYFDTLLDNLIKYGIEIGLVTNGSTLPESRIEKLATHAVWVRFSMDSSNPELHKQIHRTQNYDFERRTNNIRKMVEKKKEHRSEITIGISFIINPVNIDNVDESCLFYKKLGVDNIRFSWMYDKSGKAGLTENQIDDLKIKLDVIKLREETNDYKIFYEKERIDLFSKPNDDFKTCYMQRFVWALGADHKIYPCCIMKYHSDFALADIREKTLRDIVYDANAIAKMNNLDVRNCFPCWLRNRNITIEQAVKKPIHVNFI